MSHIELVKISKTYQKKQAVLNEINLTINKGEFFVLVGTFWVWKEYVT
ncbi:Glycerol-3-phosphate ABC transporter ATP-binding protein OS=Lysinibacillus sphaericus OX=1421 GN=LS41612_09160 PE=4 SV=1 [Lysinibacillus sphaericus]